MGNKEEKKTRDAVLQLSSVASGGWGKGGGGSGETETAELE